MVTRWGRSVALLAGTATLSLALAYAGATWIAPRLGDGQALIAWSGLAAALGAAMPWFMLWCVIYRRDQRSPSDGESVSG